MDNRSRGALIHLLIGKSIVETVLVGALTFAFFFDAFPPYFQGWGEATPRAIEGWVVNRRKATERVEVQLFIDDVFIADSIAERPRTDIVDGIAIADPLHGYKFELPALPTGNHIACVYVVSSGGGGARKSLQRVGDSIPFTIDDRGVAHWNPTPQRRWFP